MFENQKVYQIAKETKIPDQAIRDLKKGKTDIMKAKFQTVAKLYEYQKALEAQKK